jgi:hypothetical protein
VEHVVTFGLEHRVLGQIDAIGVHEIQYAKGHKYVTLVYRIGLGGRKKRQRYAWLTSPLFSRIGNSCSNSGSALGR